MRELAYMRLETEDEEIDEEAIETFEEEVDLAAEGRFVELDIDDRPLPRRPPDA